MFMLDFQLDPIASTKAKEVDMASADPVSLRYHLFPGDVIVQGEGVDFSARWGWVQVLDFVLSMRGVEAMLEQDRKARFEFTESNAALDFQLENEYVCVSSTYAPGLLRVSASEFHEQVGRFAQRVVQDLCKQHPRLALNPEISAIMT